MGTRSSRSYINLSSTITLLLVLSIACTSAQPAPNARSEPKPEAETTAEAFIEEYGFAASLTGDKDYGSIIVHENGERVITMTQTDGSGNILTVTGAAWLSPEGDSFVVFVDDNGFPERAVMGDYVFLFSDYTSNTVDITTISPDGSREVHEDVPVDLEQFSRIPSREFAALDISFLLNSGLSLWDTVKHASFVLSVAGCGVAIIMSEGVTGLLCAGAIISGINLYIDKSVQDPNASLMASGIGLGAVGCGMGDVASCVSVTVDTADVVVKAAELKREMAAGGETPPTQDQTEEKPEEVSQAQNQFGCDNPDLTPEERENCGIHVYHTYTEIIQGTCKVINNTGAIVSSLSEEYEHTISFSEDELTFEEKVWEKINENTYQRTYEYFIFTITFNSNGYTLIEEIIEFDCTSQRTANIIE